mmetsp:Transcript_29453/g.74124  ORF Transcript_29453/g.74124 Transcript_29453/m.74124 type:complete len:231 (+) Transcript_29453:497-1189(+)
MPLNTLTASSIQRSRSSRMFSVLPRRRRVEMPQRPPPLMVRNTHTLVPASSSTDTSSQTPSSSAVGAPARTRGTAPQERHTRRSWNLEGTFTTMILYRSRKCRASSLTVAPLTSTFTPTDARSLTIFSMASSSDLEYASRSSALCSSTVPLVSGLALSRPAASTASFAFLTCLMVPSASRGMAKPVTRMASDTPPPTTLVTRTLSTLNVFGLAGQISTHALAINGASLSL